MASQRPPDLNRDHRPVVAHSWSYCRGGQTRPGSKPAAWFYCPILYFCQSELSRSKLFIPFPFPHMSLFPNLSHPEEDHLDG